MDNAWKIANVTMAMSHYDLTKIALQIPTKYKPKKDDYPKRPTKADIIRFIRASRANYYDSPLAERTPSSKKSICEISASEVNQMLKSFPPAPAA